MAEWHTGFHPLIDQWFTRTYKKPTAVQAQAWPLINEGKNVLAVSPTGSGKTLTAFLAALSRFVEGAWDADKLSVLYVSPLKALNEDIKRNLLNPIASLKEFRAAGTPGGGGELPRIRVETRSGDTPSADRRRFLVHPPSILATTPESLAILLLNPRGREILSGVKCLILDEIHAVMGTMRGAFLACQVDRLSMWAGEFQRISLSATIEPLDAAAEFTGGLGRKVYIAAPQAEKSIDFKVEFPAVKISPPDGETGPQPDRYGERYTILTAYILDRIQSLSRMDPGRRASILVFTGSRRRAERIAFLVNDAAEKLGGRGFADGPTALCHHGSLSKEVRREVEQSLASGRCACVVATSSLELGLDIGSVEEVILAGTPSSCAQTLQRIGRSGHGVGEVSRGRLIPFHGTDLLLGAVFTGTVEDREIEKTKPVKNPLDLLAQIILSLIIEKTYTADELFNTIRGFQVYGDLARSSFDEVVTMLAGSEYREIKKRLYIDGEHLRPVDGVLSLLYSSGGVIPNRGLYSIRLPDGTKIGELDEEFVFERRLGDGFEFGAQSWTILDIGAEAITVVRREEAADFTPFWRADAAFRSSLLSMRILAFLDSYSADYTPRSLSPEAAEALEELLKKQRNAQGGAELPGTDHFPVEIIDNSALRQDAYQVIFHTFRGGAINYPFSMALAALLEETTGQRIEAIPDDNAVLLLLPRGITRDPASLIRGVLADKLLGNPRRGEELFRRRLEFSGVFGAAFREAAERSLILPRGSFGRRIPLWVTRRRTKQLYDKLSGGGETFPVIIEAWRSCLADRFDLEGFREFLSGLGTGSIRVDYFRSSAPSPFARDMVWKETNAFIYEYDERRDLLGRAGTPGASAGAGSLADRAIAAAMGDPSKRPRIKKSLCDSFGARLRRELPGWAPEDPLSLAEWVKERVAIPGNEWEALCIPEELKEAYKTDPSLGGRISRLNLGSAGLILHNETLKTLEAENTGGESAALPAALLTRLGTWLYYEGPVSAAYVARSLGCTPAEAEDALENLAELGVLAGDISLEDPRSTSAGDTAAIIAEKRLYCDAENFELLLRLARKKARPQIREQRASLLIPYLALRQGLIRGDTSPESPAVPPLPDQPPLPPVLSCYPAPVSLWETEFFPARNPRYRGNMLDEAIASGALLWFGAGRERAGFCTPDEFDLLFSTESGTADFPIAAFCSGYKHFWEIKDQLFESGRIQSAAECGKLLWDEAWKGALSSDSWEALRRGIDEGFALPEREASLRFGPAGVPGVTPQYRRNRRMPRTLRERRREGSPLPGLWFSLLESRCDDGGFAELEEEERCRDRVRLLLKRWGILCRPLLEREEAGISGPGPFSWSRLLPAMRRMELSGELVTGRFFEGIHSLQFASPRIAEELEAASRCSASIYWMNAADPASPAGLSIDMAEGLRFPARSASVRLCFRGENPAAISSRSGKELTVYVPPDDPELPAILEFLRVPRTRSCHPLKKISLETINGEPAASSPYGEILRESGFIPDRGKLLLW
jgi:ATP-dependent Lhr-like helicase